MNENKTITIFFVLFIIVLTIFTLLSTRVMMHDTTEYIGATKEFAGLTKTNIHVVHSMVYPYFVSKVFNFFSSIMFLKLINLIWFMLIGLILWKLFKSKNALILWIFSPIVWFTSIQIHPLPITAFFFILSYYFYKKWENKKLKTNFIYSALSLGISCVFYNPVLIYAIFFMLIFFFDKELKKTICYFIMFSIPLLFRFIFEYFIFGSPIYSLVRLFGTNVVNTLNPTASYNSVNLISGLNSQGGLISLFLPIFLLSFVVMSPFFFRIYKTRKNFKREFWLIIITFFIFLNSSYNGLTYYFLTITPLVILMLSKVLRKKEILLNILFSVIIVVILSVSFSYFAENRDVLSERDIKQIYLEYEFPEILASGRNAPYFAVFFLEEDQPKFIWFDDYMLSKENKTDYSTYSYLILPKRFDTQKAVEFNAKLRIRKPE